MAPKVEFTRSRKQAKPAVASRLAYLKTDSQAAIGSVAGKIMVSRKKLNGRSTTGYGGGVTLNFAAPASSPLIALMLSRVPL
jgi:hypothetical protein